MTKEKEHFGNAQSGTQVIGTTHRKYELLMTTKGGYEQHFTKSAAVF